MNSCTTFDPLKAKSVADTEVAALAQKREINNILNSYVGWYDPFCELIQNALDSIEERASLGESGYEPTLFITVDIKDNSLTVTDNGIGLDEDKFTKFLCPDISFKSSGTRGHKGVGATYLAYGFNFIQVATKVPGYGAIGKMENARNWLTEKNPAGNPQIKPDNEGVKDSIFDSIDKGVSIHVKFDKSTHPKDLKWIVADKAEQWFKILSVKTGLGAFSPNRDININLAVIDKEGNKTVHSQRGVEYFWPHCAVSKSASFKQIQSKEKELFEKRGKDFTLPASLTNLDACYEYWTSEELLSLLKLDEEELLIIEKHKPIVYVAYVFSLRIWEAVNSSLNARGNAKILYGGIQIAANNMPQGEIIQIPLKRNTGRQNQIHIVVHFDNCSADLGRKGFKSEIVDFAKEISKKIADGPLMKIKYTLRPNTGAAPHLKREKEIEDWKEEMVEYEKNNPLELLNENFFMPSKKISITSNPTREQDVIALFNQFLAGGVIRGVRVMSTNERLTYDGLFRVIIEEPKENHIYNNTLNPLGVDKTLITDDMLTFHSAPKVLEYKYSLDGLIEDIDSGTKNSNDISLVVVWDTGEAYKENYKITSLLDPDNLTLREYHGLTHTITNISTGQREMELIVLSELVEFLNDPEKTIKKQLEKYEE